MLIKKFLKNCNGGIASTAAILSVPLLVCCGAALDYTSLRNKQSALQNAADAAALSSAKELGIANIDNRSITSASRDHVVANLATRNDNIINGISVDAKISDSRKDVTVDISYTWQPLILHYFNQEALPIKVSSTATLAGSESLCVIALDKNRSKSLDMGGKATLNASNCAIHSNSQSPQSISVFRNSNMSGSQIYSSGGYQGNAVNFNPVPLTDSPLVEDPLAGRPAPPVGNCDENGFFHNSGFRKITKNTVFCRGLTVSGNSELRLEPGIYVIKDGPLVLQGNATLSGENVGFYFTGNNATFDFGVSTQVSLSAPQTGPLAGILFFQDRSINQFLQYTIRSKDAEKFEGTVYLPNGRLWIDKASRVGQSSRWTAIVANQIAIGNGPNIQINSDYAASQIPVPEGIGPNSDIRLKR